MTTDNILPTRGFIFYARRLNRHRYHLTKRKGAPTVCGVSGESCESTMDYLLGHDSYLVCRDCVAKAGPLASGPLGDPEVEEMVEWEKQMAAWKRNRDEAQRKLEQSEKYIAELTEKVAARREKLGPAAPPPVPEPSFPF